MTEEIEDYKAAFEEFWGQLVALPAEISDAYDICSVLSEGNGKTTFLVCEKEDGARAIVKTADATCKENLEEEYALLRKLDGGGFPRAIAYHQDGEHRYLIREYVEGVTLDTYIDLHGVFSEEQCARITHDLCNNILRLHSLPEPIIHRDIKPQNIIYTPQKNCILIDLGAARHYRDKNEKDTVYIGTAIAAAPEQFGYRQTDVRSDVYALGVLMLYLCTGSYDLARCGEIKNKRLADIIRRCTRFDPADRYPSVQRVQTHLNLILNQRLRSYLNLILNQRLRSYRSFSYGLALGLTLGALLCFVTLRQSALLAPADEAASVLPTVAAPAETDAQPVVFSSELIERAARETLGYDATTPIYESDLDRVTQLMIHGDVVYSDWDTYIHDVTYQRGDGNGTLFSMEDIAKFPNLHILGIVDQKLFDLSILKQTMIETLVLSDNLITDLSPLTEMPCLSKLYLRGNPITDISVLSQIPTLKMLDIGGTYVTDLSPINGINLQKLWLNETPIVNYSPLLSLNQLETLWVSRLDAEALSVCSQLTQLYSLSIYETPALTSLSPLADMTNLSFLDLVNDGITNIEDVGRFPYLYYFCLMGNPITDLSPLTNPPIIRSLNLTSLDIDDYSFLTQISTLKVVYCNAKQGEMIRALPGTENIELIVG